MDIKETVYCGDCRYHKKKEYLVWSNRGTPIEFKPTVHYCKHPKHVQYDNKDTPIEQNRIKQYGQCEIINKNNDCEEFKVKRTGLVIFILLVVFLMIVIGVAL